MFCDQCGTALVEGQQRCARCGKPVMGYARRTRVQDHIRLLAVLWMALGAFSAVGGGVLLIVANTIFARWHDLSGPASGAPMFLHPLLTFLGIFVLLKALASFAAGYGLLQREPWARVLALVLAFISLFNVPFGTALGIYTLWVLLPAHAEEEYQALRRAA
jgi:hypothetical protein